MTPASVLAPVIKISGAELPTAWTDALVDMRIELEFRLAARAILRFVDPAYTFAEGSLATLGNEVEIHARDQGMLMRGDITGVTVEHRVGDTPELVIVVHDRAARLARATKVDTFVTTTYSDIVTQMAGAHGMTASVDATKGTVDYLMQVDSDLALLDAIADRVGYDWWIDNGELQFKKPTATNTVQLKLAEDLLAFSVRASGLHADSVRVDGWDREQQKVVSGHTDAASVELKPNSTLVSHYLSPGSKLGGSAEFFSAGVSASSPSEATELSAAMANRAVAGAVTARGILAGDARIKLGVCVEVSDSGPIAGKYHVTKVEHIFRPTGFETRFVAGDRQPTGLVDTLGGGVARPSIFHHAGLVVGEVTNINDDKKIGRVKVRFPGLSTQQESGWARVVTMGGGKDRGMVFLPEVGDEVLVGFEGGDLRQPVVLGGLFGAKSTIPIWDVKEGKVNGRRITSRLGHLVELADGESPETQHVLLQLEGGNSKLRLGKDKVDLEVPSGVPVTIKSGEGSITIGKDGSITLSGPTVTIEAKQKLSVSAGAQAELKSNGGLTMQASGQTAVKGAMLQVEATGIAEIKGSMVKIN